MVDRHVTSTGNTLTTTKERDWHPMFIEHFAEHANVTQAAVYAGVDRHTVYQHRKNDAAFAEQWHDALEMAIETLEGAMRSKAMTMADMPSVTAGIFLLKAHRPTIYRDNIKVEHTVTHRLETDTMPEYTEAELAAIVAQKALPAPGGLGEPTEGE